MTASPVANPKSAWHRWVPVAALAVLLLAASLVPADWLKVVDYAGLAVCHRIPARSFFVAQTQLPVCARDTGMFSMAVLGLLVIGLRIPTRAGGYPRGVFLALLGIFFCAWAFDGFNSYMLLLRRSEFLYAPSNTGRLVTGALMGIVLSVFASALFNQAVWRNIDETPALRNWRDLLSLLAAAAALIVLVLWRPPVLHGALTTLSGVGIVAMLTLANGILAMIALRRYSTFQHWREVAPYLALGCAMAIGELAVLSGLRLAFLPTLPL
jgi:uncharacterized membrane protein